MKRLIPLLVLTYFLVGCSIAASKYNTDFNNVSYLRKEKLNQVRVDPVVKDTKSKDVDKLTIRGATFESPYGSYTSYVESALKQELEDARLLDPNSKVYISTTLLKNEFDASGINIGIAEMEARFVVKNDNETLYDKTKSARHTWESAYLAATAVPAAQNNFPIVVQKLIGSLFSDHDFIAALRQK